MRQAQALLLVTSAILTLGVSVQASLAASGSWLVAANRDVLVPALSPAENQYISQEILLVADNQQHNLFNEQPVLYRRKLVDGIIDGAIRPPALDLFGKELLTWTVEQAAEEQLVLHLGDAADFSCRGEIEEFLAMMAKAPLWLMTPGNHDGYFYGNEWRPPKKNFEKACGNAGGPLRKDLFLRYYLAAQHLKNPFAQTESCSLSLNDDASGPENDHDGGSFTEQLRWLAEHAIPDTGNCRTRADDTLRTIYEWNIDTDKPWRSFVIQQADISRRETEAQDGPRVSLMLLDTAQYRQAPCLAGLLPVWCVNAGKYGRLLEKQRTVAERWLAETDQETLWIIAGHHPIGRLGRSEKWLLEQIREHSGLLYLSAHTHAGGYTRHFPSRNPSADPVVLELTTGSMVDFPPEYRTLRVYSGPRYGVVSTRNDLYEEFLQVRRATSASSGAFDLHSTDQPPWEAFEQFSPDVITLRDAIQYANQAPSTAESHLHATESHTQAKQLGKAERRSRNAEWALKRNLLEVYLNLLCAVPSMPDPTSSTCDSDQLDDLCPESTVHQTYTSTDSCGDRNWDIDDCLDEDYRSDLQALACIQVGLDRDLEDKVAILLKLREYDARRSKGIHDAEYRKYQAVRASRIDHGRRLLVGDEILTLPAPAPHD